ncbi:MAG: hypothetical protein QXG39_00415 [Candidatus Aenigmatarchaeota archaeon]
MLDRKRELFLKHLKIAKRYADQIVLTLERLGAPTIVVNDWIKVSRTLKNIIDDFEYQE